MKSTEKTKKQLITKINSLQKHQKKLKKLTCIQQNTGKALRKSITTHEKDAKRCKSIDGIINRQLRSEIEYRKQLEQAAEDAQNYAESIINTVRRPLIVLDAELRVVSASRSFYQSFQVKPEETEKQRIYDLGNRQWDIPKLRELLEDILPKTTSLDDFEVEHVFPEIGKRIMVLNALKIYQKANRKQLILLSIEDITGRREIENGMEKAHEELKKLAAELKRAAQAKAELLANMSHDFMTPLTSINGFSEVLYDETFGPLNEKQKKYVSNVLTSGKHLLLLINRILDIAKVEAGKMKLSLSNLPMKSLEGGVR